MSLNCDNKTPRDGTFLGEKQPTHLYQVHIADGFSSDCDEIVHRCLQLENLNFQEFTKIWKDMNFDLLYEGRAASTEIAELSEELIHVAKHYMVKDTSYFEESVTGLFLVYSLIHLQPFPGFARLRLVPGDVKPISRIEAVARRERRLDVLYILGDVLVHWTQYHADERPRGMERPVKKYLDGYISIDKLGSRPKGVFYLQSEELDHIRELGPITRQYGLAKAAIFNSGIEQDMRNPQYISKSLASEVAASLRDLIIGLNPDASVPAPHQRDANNAPSSKAETKTSEERSRILQAIKARAMSNAVDPMNHLTSAQARKKPKPRLNIAGDLKKPTGRIRTGAHIRPGTISPKKPKTTMKSVMKSRLEQTCYEADLDMESFKQVQEDGTPEQESPGPQNSRAIDIEIDSLPLILKAGDMGPDIEIEIIDHAKSNTDKTAPKTASSTKTNKTAGSEIEIEIVDHKKRNKGKQTEPKAANSTETTKTSSSEDDDTQMLTINPRALKMFMKDGKDGKTELVDGFPLKKKERRDMKRRDIKSKFKKLGMLQIANLEDKEI